MAITAVSRPVLRQRSRIQLAADLRKSARGPHGRAHFARVARMGGSAHRSAWQRTSNGHCAVVARLSVGRVQSRRPAGGHGRCRGHRALNIDLGLDRGLGGCFVQRCAHRNFATMSRFAMRWVHAHFCGWTFCDAHGIVRSQRGYWIRNSGRGRRHFGDRGRFLRVIGAGRKNEADQ